jgi:hypothetical protein
MKLRLTRRLALTLLAGTLTLAHPSRTSAEPVPLDVNDVSFLWPVPEAGGPAMLSLTDKGADGADLLPDETFDKLLDKAQDMRAANGPKIRFAPGLRTKANWKVAAIRFNPCSAGSSPAIIKAAGEIPGIRLVVQPVVAGKVQDVAAHVAFNFVTTPTPPFQPDKVAFNAVVNDLKALKGELEAAGVVTDEPLGEHPAFSHPEVDLTGKLRALLARHVSQQRLIVISFMGIPQPAPEPWIFFSVVAVNGQLVDRPVGGNFVPETPPVLAQMIAFVGPSRIVPAVTPDVAAVKKGLGISTAPLFKPGVNLEERIFPDAPVSAQLPHAQAKFKDIPDLIANPLIHSTVNTDCASCHTESTRRAVLPGAQARSPFAFPLASPVRPEALPRDRWNVRVFGWGVDASRRVSATVTMRAANEAAESAAYINEHYSNP